MNLRTRIAALGCAMFVSTFASTIQAAVITPGVYLLHNHPDGAIREPSYGLRLDELFNISSGLDYYTCDFDNSQSEMKLIYDTAANPDTITITGMSLCGRDTGSSYANDVYKAVYTIHFVYNIGVGQVPGDDDIQVLAASGSNSGSISHPTLGTKNLTDVQMGNTFRFGDEDNDAGHRGFNGISGWGWLAINGTRTTSGSDDWLFTAEKIPEPTTMALLGLAAMFGIRRSKRA